MNITNLYIRALCLICIFLFGVYSSNAFSFDADSLFNSGNYVDAAIQYERDYFEANNVLDQKIALLHKSYCYKALGDFNHAFLIAKRGIDLGIKDSLEYLFRYESIINAYLSGNSAEALSEIKLIEYYFPDMSHQDKSIVLLNVLVLNEQARWEEAKEILRSKIDILGIDQKNIEELYKPSSDVKLKNPNKAFSMSLLLPGVGQMYAGHFGKGVLSLALQAGAIAYGIHSFKQGYFFSGALPGVAVFNSFYMGGANYAKKLVEERNRNKTNALNSDLNNSLMKFFSIK